MAMEPPLTLYAIVSTQLITAVKRLAGESFIELPQINIDFQAMAFQQARHGKNRTNAHFIRL